MSHVHVSDCLCSGIAYYLSKIMKGCTLLLGSLITYLMPLGISALISDNEVVIFLFMPLFIVFHVGQELTAVQYEPPKPKPMVRPAYLYFMPSPAAMSFNFAVANYRPGSAHPASHDHSGQQLRLIGKAFEGENKFCWSH